MNAIQRPARVNVKLLVILVLVTGLVGVGAVVMQAWEAQHEQTLATGA